MMFLYGKLVPLELKDTVTVFPLKVYFQLQYSRLGKYNLFIFLNPRPVLQTVRLNLF